MSATYKKLEKLIQPSNITTKPGTSYYISGKSASTTEDDEIYIDCQPVGDTSNNTTEGFQTILRKETQLQSMSKLLVSAAVISGLLLLSCRLTKK